MPHMKMMNILLLTLTLAFASFAHATTITVTHATGTNDFRTNGTIYYMDGVGSGTPLTLIRGETYTFDYSSAQAGGHPLRFVSDDNSNNSYTAANAYTDGLSIPASDTWRWTVADDAPDTLYYVCSAHSGMGGTIQIQSAATPSQQVPTPLWVYFILPIVFAVVSFRAYRSC